MDVVYPYKGILLSYKKKHTVLLIATHEKKTLESGNKKLNTMQKITSLCTYLAFFYLYPLINETELK